MGSISLSSHDHMYCTTQTRTYSTVYLLNTSWSVSYAWFILGYLLSLTEMSRSTSWQRIASFQITIFGEWHRCATKSKSPLRKWSSCITVNEMRTTYHEILVLVFLSYVDILFCWRLMLCCLLTIYYLVCLCAKCFVNNCSGEIWAGMFFPWVDTGLCACHGEPPLVTWCIALSLHARLITRQ